MKKILTYTLSLLMIIGLLVSPNLKAQAASVSLGVSASTVSIGENVKVTVTVPDGTTATIDLKDWSSVLSFSSASVDVGNNGGTITINVGKMSMAGTNTVTITFKAKTSGTANITANVVSAVDNNTVEDVALSGASTKIVVENKTTDTGNQGGDSQTPQKSSDNSLSSLKLSNATLSPSFKKGTLKYTAAVDYDVTKVVVSAKTSHAKAVIESVTDDGTVNLKVGENTIKIVVRAENGVKATYTIVVTRKAQESTPVTPPEGTTPPSSEVTPPEVNEMLQWNGEQLQPAESIPAERIPADFESTLLVVNGQQMQGLSFAKGDLKLLYLNNTNNAGALYVFDDAQQTIYPFIKLLSEKGYVVVLLPDEQNAPAPEGFESCTFSIEGKGIVNAYQLKEESTASDFYLMYCMNAAGEKGWYMYDSVEGTYLRYFSMTPSVQTGGNPADNDSESKYAALEKELNAAKMTQYIIIAIAAAVVCILIIVIIVLAVRKGKKDARAIDESPSIEQTVVAKEPLIVETDSETEDEEIEIEFYEMEAPEAEPETEPEEAEDEEIEIEFYEMEAPEAELETEPEEAEDEEIEIEFYEMEAPEVEPETEPEEAEDEEVEIEFYEMETPETEPEQEPEIKIVRKPRMTDTTSKFSSRKAEDDDDLEFIDFD